MFLKKILIIIIAFLVSPGMAKAAELSAGEKESIGQVVHDYLLENPEVVIEAIEKYRERQAAEQNEQAAASLEKYKSYLFGKDRPFAGNPDGDVTVVEFFDYNCGYCKRALTDILAVIDTDKNVRFNLIEMPILSPSSETASTWALAAHKQDKYFEYHKLLMKHVGQKSEAALEKLAKQAGLDVARLRKDAESPEIMEELNKIRKIAAELGVRGTPAFIAGDNVIRGYVGTVGLKEAVKEVRNNKQ